MMSLSKNVSKIFHKLNLFILIIQRFKSNSERKMKEIKKSFFNI